MIRKFITNRKRRVWSRFFFQSITGGIYEAPKKLKAILFLLRRPRSEATNYLNFKNVQQLKNCESGRGFALSQSQVIHTKLKKKLKQICYCCDA